MIGLPPHQRRSQFWFQTSASGIACALSPAILRLLKVVAGPGTTLELFARLSYLVVSVFGLLCGTVSFDYFYFAPVLYVLSALLVTFLDRLEQMVIFIAGFVEFYAGFAISVKSISNTCSSVFAGKAFFRWKALVYMIICWRNLRARDFCNEGWRSCSRTG